VETNNRLIRGIFYASSSPPHHLHPKFVKIAQAKAVWPSHKTRDRYFLPRCHCVRLSVFVGQSDRGRGGVVLSAKGNFTYQYSLLIAHHLVTRWHEMTREQSLVSCIYQTELINDGATTRTRTIVVGFPSKYVLAEIPTPNILAIQNALAPARAASLNAFGGICLKCSICGKDETAFVCSTVVAYRATNRDLNAVEIGCYVFFGNHRAPVLVDNEHQNKHQTLILSERFICVCNDHHCISEARVMT
jgi:hypothetical protein